MLRLHAHNSLIFFPPPVHCSCRLEREETYFIISTPYPLLPISDGRSALFS